MWVADLPTTSGKFEGGEEFDDISANLERIASRSTFIAVRGRDKRFYIGLMILEIIEQLNEIML